ncbi:ATP-dependent DNA helicase PIF1 [Elysia marginata]|uniref:ATP-dependent DNA helicase PIF1 n=1 Tax=Elysia marginata TaxID=1093978 RepID=A0AAV4FGG1_9GAST|nr:ATP-dependent DNA helicase PIF1 [Elysia marginata]
MSALPEIYHSINTTLSDEDAAHYPTEFLDSIEIAGLPPNKLSIKTGMPVMVLRSLNPPRLMNGTRCIVTKAMRNLIEVKIASGPFKDEKHLIPRIRLQPSDTALPFTFQRQHPLRPCFSLTINKAQGQSLRVVGLDLRSQVFTHGMLYVALSRTGRKNDVYILAEDGMTPNVVYSEVLNYLPTFDSIRPSSDKQSKTKKY